uniref:Pseudouridine synthase family protein n=1 Tax=Solanum tuberosum TaxID=4113 RepID=M1ABS9_SOLTU
MRSEPRSACMHRTGIRIGDYEEKLDSDWLVAFTSACSISNLADLIRYIRF